MFLHYNCELWSVLTIKCIVLVYVKYKTSCLSLIPQAVKYPWILTLQLVLLIKQGPESTFTKKMICVTNYLMTSLIWWRNRCGLCEKIPEIDSYHQTVNESDSIFSFPAMIPTTCPHHVYFEVDSGPCLIKGTISWTDDCCS